MLTCAKRRRRGQARLLRTLAVRDLPAAQGLASYLSLDFDYTPFEDIALLFRQVPGDPMHMVGGLCKGNLGALVLMLNAKGKVHVLRRSVLKYIA